MVLGFHTIADYSGCSAAILNNLDSITNILIQAAQISGSTIVKTDFHHFSPHGISGVVIIQESHITIHTWPEHGFAAVDFFSCNDSLKVTEALEFITKELEAKHKTIHTINRITQ
jgi:S-adenosylmethionine decarboxylase proenzyme